MKRQEKLGNISEYVLDMYKHLVALKDEERQQKLFASRVLSIDPQTAQGSLFLLQRGSDDKEYFSHLNEISEDVTKIDIKD